MANPSDTGGSGVGLEVLRRASGTIDGTTPSVLTVGTNKIYTILSVIITNTNATTASTAKMFANDGTDRIIFQLVDGATGKLEKRATFVFSDKLVLTDGDILKIEFNQQCDYWISYIDQEFTT